MSDDYDKLYKQAVKAYNKAEFKTSYNHFLTVANNGCRFADDAKFYLAKQHEKRLPQVAKNYFSLYEQVSNTFELYLNIYIKKPDKFKGTNLLLLARIENNRDVFTDKKKEF
ncbi:22280_t:CDS:2 [Gigaspora margarita]|uniref:22280_t:CDS:1 n=1 Tax=Gigaspora margarita TaxID=4874 RepID=A0ABM8W745_GIGMA|nr:22280_t:CDS:2 [Gigaspora margarita]